MLLASAAFSFLIQGCSNEATVIKIAYEHPAMDASSDSGPATAKAGKKEEGNSIAQTKENTGDGASDLQDTGKIDMPFGMGMELSPLPVLNPTILPMATLTAPPLCTPMPSPTLRPSPTLAPMVTSTPLITPTPIPSPTKDPAQALEDEAKRYETAIQKIQAERELQLRSFISQIGALEANKAAFPESAAEIQAEIDAINGSISALERDIAEKMQAEQERYLAAIAPYGGG